MARLIALLPMKGHSERVADKNLRHLGGRPLYHWVMETLLSVAQISEVVVDTDSDRIEVDVSDHFPGVTLRRRPADLLGDWVPMHDIVHRFAEETPRAEAVLQTHATNPLLTPATVRRAIDALYATSTHDSLMSVTAWHTRLFDGSGKPLNHNPEVLKRTQDLSPVYEENSNLYIASREAILATKRRIGRNPLLFPIDRMEAVDIDDEVDFAIAECLIGSRDA